MIAKYYNFRRHVQHPPDPVFKVLKIGYITDTHVRYGVDSNPNAPKAQGSGSSPNGRIYFASNNKIRHFIEKVNSGGDFDVIIHGGDMCDTPEDFEFFLDEWGKANVGEKHFLLGNHDLDDYDYSELAQVLGIDPRGEVGVLISIIRS